MTARTSWYNLWRPSLQRGTELLKHQKQRWIPLQTRSHLFKVGICPSVCLSSGYRQLKRDHLLFIFVLPVPAFLCFLCSYSFTFLVWFVFQYTFSHSWFNILVSRIAVRINYEQFFVQSCRFSLLYLINLLFPNDHAVWLCFCAFK